jgi:hypothetical protein
MPTTQTFDPATLAAGDAFTVLVFGGPQAEMICWGRTDDGHLIATWAMRGLGPFRPEEGPKDASEPFLLTPGPFQAGNVEGVTWRRDDDATRGIFVATSGRYEARDERHNGVSVMTAQHRARLGL